MIYLSEGISDPLHGISYPAFQLEEDGVMSFADHDQPFGFTHEFVEKKMLDGSIRRYYKGRRFHCSVRFGWLPPVKIGNTTYLYGGIYELLDIQMRTGRLYAVEIDCPDSVEEKKLFSGWVNVDLDDSQKRFKYIPATTKTNAQYMWTGFRLNITACDLIPPPDPPAALMMPPLLGQEIGGSEEGDNADNDVEVV